MEVKDMLYTSIFTDMMSEGLIVIDKSGIIQIYNASAREIFGIDSKDGVRHDPGFLEEGDLVIIANNSFGADDGSMDLDSLKSLGLKGGEIDQGQAFILVSRFQGENLALEKAVRGQEKIEISCRYLDQDIYSSIGFKDKKILISAAGHDFILDYINEIGHMVILDGSTGELKFYQTNGYTARKESINDILKGKSYKGKGGESGGLRVVGKNIFDIHDSQSIIQDFLDLARGRKLECIDRYEEINGYPTLCSLKAVELEGERKGAALIVEDISKIKQVMKERDGLIRKLEEASKSLKEERELEEVFPNFIGRDERILDVKRRALRASKTSSPILLLGKKGVGKSLLARNIHQASFKKDGEFINLDGESLEDFQSLYRDGSIYIENIDGLSLNLQEDLLEILEDQSAYGGLRFMASTSKNLDEMVMKGEFKDDLYYRINILPIHIPELKDRRSDLRFLVDYLLPRICDKAGLEEKRISTEAMELIESYHWPGNVRELENVLERAVNYALGNNILTKHIVFLEEMKVVEDGKMTLKEALEEREKTIIKTSLAQNKGDRKKTIEDLGISQSTFYERLNKYNIS